MSFHDHHHINCSLAETFQLFLLVRNKSLSTFLPSCFYHLVSQLSTSTQKIGWTICVLSCLSSTNAWVIKTPLTTHAALKDSVSSFLLGHLCQSSTASKLHVVICQSGETRCKFSGIRSSFSSVQCPDKIGEGKNKLLSALWAGRLQEEKDYHAIAAAHSSSSLCTVPCIIEFILFAKTYKGLNLVSESTRNALLG